MDEAADPAAQCGAGLLIETEVNTAVDAGVVDVLGDLLEFGVIQDRSRYRRVREGNGVPASTVYQFQHVARRIA